MVGGLERHAVACGDAGSDNSLIGSTVGGCDLLAGEAFVFRVRRRVHGEVVTTLACIKAERVAMPVGGQLDDG